MELLIIGILLQNNFYNFNMFNELNKYVMYIHFILYGLFLYNTISSS